MLPPVTPLTPFLRVQRKLARVPFISLVIPETRPFKVEAVFFLWLGLNLIYSTGPIHQRLGLLSLEAQQVYENLETTASTIYEKLDNRVLL